MVSESWERVDGGSKGGVYLYDGIRPGTRFRRWKNMQVIDKEGHLSVYFNLYPNDHMT